MVASCKATEPLLKNGPVQYCQSPAVHPAKNSYLFSANLGFAGICGTYDFRGGNQRGLTADNVAVLRWDNGKSDWVTAGTARGKAPK